MRVMNNLKMAVAAVALLLMASCGSTRKMEGTGKVNAQNRKTETKAADAAEVASMRTWLSCRRLPATRCMPRTSWAI